MPPVSYHADDKGNSILDQMCFSAERLAQYPDSAFQEQLSALFLHELSHVAGYEETDAVSIQNYAVKKILTPDCSIFVYSDNANDNSFVSFGLILQEGFAPYVKVNRQFTQGALQTFELDNYHTSLPAPVEFRWSPAGGHIQFTSLDVDGQLRVNQVDWEGDVNPVNGFDNHITKSNLTFASR
jgi:hypothetical protein